MKKTRLFLTAAILTLGMSMTSFAGTWQAQDNGQWKYQNDDGSYAVGWVTDNGKSYYMDVNGIMLTKTLTPDDYYVGSDGACVRDFVIYDESTYQGVLDSYTAKLKSATPILVEEYKEEAKTNNNRFYGLAEINVQKIQILADIDVNGICKMADIWLNYGSGNYDEYSDWANKLSDAYTEQANILSDVYMDSAL